MKHIPTTPRRYRLIYSAADTVLQVFKEGMKTCCCVPGCSKKSVGHIFPRDKLLKKKWVHATKRAHFKPSAHSRVCSDHFLPGDYVEQSWASKEAGVTRRYLKKGAVPSVFPWTQEKEPSNRSIRMQQRKQIMQQDGPDGWVESDRLAVDAICGNEVEVESSQESDIPPVTSPAAEEVPKFEEKSTQAGLKDYFGIHKWKNNDKAIEYFTGFKDYDHFRFVFSLLGESVNCLNYGSRYSELSIIDPENAFFLTLFKLRRGTPDVELGFHFGMSDRQVGVIFATWINFLFYEMKDWGITPADRAEGDVQLILDCTEMKIAQPTDPVLQQMTYSNYKSANTMKSLVGIDCKGMVNFVSDAYGGAYSDRAILEKSGVLDHLSPGDVLLVDRGFHIEDMCNARGLIVNAPASLRGRTQLTPRERLNSSMLSSRRIHIERVIGLAKTYKMLKNELHQSKMLLGSRIVYVCFMLANLRFQIVK